MRVRTRPSAAVDRHTLILHAGACPEVPLLQWPITNIAYVAPFTPLRAAAASTGLTLPAADVALCSCPVGLLSGPGSTWAAAATLVAADASHMLPHPRCVPDPAASSAHSAPGCRTCSQRHAVQRGWQGRVDAECPASGGRTIPFTHILRRRDIPHNNCMVACCRARHLATPLPRLVRDAWQSVAHPGFAEEWPGAACAAPGRERDPAVRPSTPRCSATPCVPSACAPCSRTTHLTTHVTARMHKACIARPSFGIDSSRWPWLAPLNSRMLYSYRMRGARLLRWPPGLAAGRSRRAKHCLFVLHHGPIHGRGAGGQGPPARPARPSTCV